MNHNIVDDEYTVITVDIEKIQQKPTMYISYSGPAGTKHIHYEITNNIIDEHQNPNSISDGKASIYHDASENMSYFQDHGRGIPFDQLENMCTILQAGAKMDRAYGTTAGENGVGLTATNALSEVFEITSTRNGKSKFLQFQEGKKIIDREISIEDTDKHGLLVAFKPSKYFMGNDCALPIDEYMEWLQKSSFFFPEDLEIEFVCDNLPGKQASIHKTYKNMGGVSGYVKLLMPEANLLAQPIILSANMPIVEHDVPVRNEDGTIELTSIDRTISIDVAFNFNPKSQDPRFDAYCNNIENIQGGEHLNAVKSAISSFFMKAMNDSKRKNDKLEYTTNDVLAGIYCVLNMSTDMSTKFESQTKHKLGNKLFYAPVRKLCIDALKQLFKLPEMKRTMTTILDYVKFNAKLRSDNEKQRKTVKTNGTTFLEAKHSLNCISSYVPANNIGKKDGRKKELFIVEGDSAGGNVRAARADSDIQGILALIGKCPCGYRHTASNIGGMLEEFFDKILGCGFGRHFNIDNLLYDRICIDSDADVDGDHICGLLLGAIVKHAPELIIQGHVYRCIMPLYKLVDKRKSKTKENIDKSLFLYHKSELFKIFERSVSKVIRLKFDLDGDFISSANMMRFLYTNRDYYTLLSKLSKHYSLHKDIVEYIAMNPDTFKETIHELGDELNYYPEDDCISGAYQKESYNLIPDKIFMSKLKYLIDVIRIGNEGITHYHMYELKGTPKEFVYQGYKTIGQILEICQKFAPDVSNRYKGLGELNPVEMAEIAMNPNNRMLIQFTIEDMEFVRKTFDVLFLDSHRPTRKQMVQEANISEDDIDN